MTRRGLIDNLWYRYEYQGEMERDGKICKKYKRLPRFPHFKKYLFRLTLTLVLMGVVAAITANYYNSSTYKNLKKYKALKNP